MICWGTEAGHQRPRRLQFHSHDTFRGEIRRGAKQVGACRGWGAGRAGGMGSHFLMSVGLSFRVTKIFWNYIEVVIATAI